MKNKEYYKGFLMGAAVVLLLGCGGYYALGLQDSILSDPVFISKLRYLEKLIDEYYLEEAAEEALEEGVYAGILTGLSDPYSCYYTAEQYQSEMAGTEGSYVGIGILMQKDPQGVLVVECYEGSSGEQAGLKAGDIIRSIDGTDLTALDLEETAALIRETEAKEVDLTIYRESTQTEMQMTIPIRDVELKSVFPEMLTDTVGYIRISEFSGVTDRQYQTAFEELKEQGMEKLVVDLRDNPGGMLTSVCSILDEILPEGLLVYTEDKYGNKEEIRSDSECPLSVPMAVLVNKGSASAAEIFAGAVQDYEAGVIVGMPTYGKGVVQSVRTLSDGSAVKLTVSRYYTPNGNDIHEVGITPDIKAEPDAALSGQQKISHEEDVVLQEALKILEKTVG